MRKKIESTVKRNRMFQWAKGRLRTKFFLYMFFLIVLLMAGVFFMVEKNSRTMILTEGKKRAVSNALYLAALSKAPLLLYDYTKLEQNVDEVAKEPEVVYACILDRQGKVISHSNRDDLIGKRLNDPISVKAIQTHTKLVQEYVYAENGEAIWDVSYPIYQQNERWGTVRVGFSKELLKKEIAQNRKDLIILALIAIILAGGVATMLSERISVPILHLSHAATLISKGDLQQKITIHTGDEIELLANTFNQMSADLEKNRVQQKQLIEELQVRNKQLNKEVTARKQLEEEIVKMERLRALGQMSGGVAHDFNNILGAILGRAQLLLEQVHEPQIQRGIKIIEKAAFDGAETVRRIQEFSRVRVDSSEFVPLSMNEVVKDSIEFTRTKWKNEAQLRGAHIDVVQELDTLPEMMGEPTGLREVFTNLIINAVDAMPHGGLIHITTKKYTNEILITVSDTGIGMSKEIVKRTFDPFFTTKGSRGNGLGLSICYGIISRHRGTIEVESEEGVGTTFTIRIPLILPGVSKKQSADISKDVSPGNVLVIDDDDTIRSLITDILEQSGCKITSAQTGNEGIELWDSSRHDIVLTDLGLEDMSGWDVVRAVKNDSPTTPVIVITGWGAQLDKAEAKKYGVDFILPKPFRINELKDYINRAMNLKMSTD